MVQILQGLVTAGKIQMAFEVFQQMQEMHLRADEVCGSTITAVTYTSRRPFYTSCVYVIVALVVSLHDEQALCDGSALSQSFANAVMLSFRAHSESRCRFLAVPHNIDRVKCGQQSSDCSCFPVI
jgi:pentatricopeptide repeat protein